MEGLCKFCAAEVELVKKSKLFENTRINAREAPVDDGNRLGNFDVKDAKIAVTETEFLVLQRDALRFSRLFQLVIYPVFHFFKIVKRLPRANV